MQVVAVVEQVAQGEVQASHSLLDVFPYCPEGQLVEQVEAVRKLGETQAVQVDAEPLHLVHGELQFLHCQSVESPHCPSGHVARHVLLVR